MGYVSSNNNRFYVTLEGSYGVAGSVTPQNRIPAVKLTAKNTPERLQRKDKTGSRTYAGIPSNIRKTTNFELSTYMTNWADPRTTPAHGPLFQACFGAAAMSWAGGTVASSVDPVTLAFTGQHGLTVGQGVANGPEIRFAAEIVDSQTIRLNAPFTNPVPASGAIGPTVTYQPGAELPSATIFDYWSPGTAVQRVLAGAAVDQLKISLNGDFHEFQFSGQASDILDSVSFQAGQAALASFPPEPLTSNLQYSIVPGHLGQIWLGSSPTQFLTVTKAD